MSTTTQAKAPAKKTASTMAAAKKRTTVPAPTPSQASSSALDALTGAAHAPGTVQLLHLDLLDPHPHNPRRDVGDVTELADSIREQGIRQNLLVVPNPDAPGRFRLVIGHRRAAAAALAGLQAVPGVVDETLTDTAQRELMLVENVQRTDLSPVEEADAYQGLLDLGLDVDTLARRTGRSATTVRTRLRLLTLPEDARAKIHTHEATLADAAALAEFDDDEETLAELAERLGQPSFPHALQRARDRRAEEQASAALRADLEARGARVLAEAPSVWGSSIVRELANIAASPGTDDHKPITADEHASCPGHVAWIGWRWEGSTRVAVPKLGCDDVATHGHRPTWGGYFPGTEPVEPVDEADPEEAARAAAAEAARAAAAEELRAAFAAAETVRTEWITAFLARTKRPANSLSYVARTLAARWDLFDGIAVAAQWLGLPEPDEDDDTPLVAALTDDALSGQFLIACALAANDGDLRLPVHASEMRLSDPTADHLAQLEAWGYALAEHEREALTAWRERVAAEAAAVAAAEAAAESADTESSAS